jgi:hypothetical protein
VCAEGKPSIAGKFPAGVTSPQEERPDMSKKKRRRIDMSRRLEDVFPTPPTSEQLQEFFRQAAAQFLADNPGIVKGFIEGKAPDAIVRDLGLKSPHDGNHGGDK